MDNNLDHEKKEFRSFGMTMENLSIAYGLFLIIWGIVISFLSKSVSFTSYIPSFFGLPILIFAYLSLKFTSKKKLFMHIVVLFGLVAFLGGLDFLRSILSGTAFQNVWADTSKCMMLITGASFVYLCVKSFIFARKNRNSQS